LISAIDLKDYTLAESLIKDLKKSAKDFDSSKPVAAIETARTVASMAARKFRPSSRQARLRRLRCETFAWD